MVAKIGDIVLLDWNFFATAAAGEEKIANVIAFLRDPSIEYKYVDQVLIEAGSLMPELKAALLDLGAENITDQIFGEGVADVDDVIGDYGPKSSSGSYCQIWCLRIFGHAALWSSCVASIPSLNLTPATTLAR